MAFTRIRELPVSTNLTNSITLPDQLVIEQDITRRIAPLDVLKAGISKLPSDAYPVTTSDLIPITPAGQNLSYNSSLQNIAQIVHQNPPSIYNSVYVATNGTDDSTHGLNPNTPFKTIKYAATYVANQNPSSSNPWSIFVKNGVYNQEQNPIWIPPHTSLIGDNLRRTIIDVSGTASGSPSISTYDILWLSVGCYVWGFKFIGHNKQAGYYAAAAIAFPICGQIANGNTPIGNFNPNQIKLNYYNPQQQYNCASNNGTIANYPNSITDPSTSITLSPYVQGCTSYAQETTQATNTTLGTQDAGCGMRIDGYLVSGDLRSMVLDSFTQINQGGRGIHIINQGYAQLVSIFTVCTTEGILCENGGTCSISTSNCTFGLSGLVAKGASQNNLQGTFTGVTTSNDPNITDTIKVNNITSVAVYNGTTPVRYPYTGMCFTIGAPLSIGSGNPINPQGLCEKYINPNSVNPNRANLFYVNSIPLSPTQTGDGTWHISLDNAIPKDLYSRYLSDGGNMNIYFYSRSIIETGGHTFEYMGTGTEFGRALPALGGVVNNGQEVCFDAKIGNYTTNSVSYDPAIVYYTSSNEVGNFNVGPNFQVQQNTGTIVGTTFNKAIIALVTPLNIILE